MNAFSTIEIDDAPSFSLATVDTITPAIVFVPGGVERIISRLEEEVRAIPLDISTAAGREAVKSLAYKVARSKTCLDDMGKELVAGIKKQSGLIDADRRIIRDRMDALRDEVRAQLTAWEDAEADRVALHESALVFLAEAARFASPPSTETIRERVASVCEACSRDWQEFEARADVLAGEAGAALANMLFAAEQAERDAAELADLRRQRVEREEADAKAAWQKAENERMQQAAEEAAERERDRAEQQATRDKARAEQAERDKIAAAARAVEQERERIARVKADDERATAKREANKKHRNKVHAEIAHAIDQAFNGAEYSPERLIEAISAGIIPHVSITY